MIAEDQENEYVLGFLLDQAHQRVALIRKNRPAWMSGKWNGIGGHVRVGELPVDAMAREFIEEAGAAVSSWVQMATVRPTAEVTVYVYTADCPDGATIMSMTHEVVQWFRVEDLPVACLPNVRWLIAMAVFDRQENWPYAIEQLGSHENN